MHSSLSAARQSLCRGRPVIMDGLSANAIASSSRNDVFITTWATELTPPRPLPSANVPPQFRQDLRSSILSSDAGPSSFAQHGMRGAIPSPLNLSRSGSLQGYSPVQLDIDPAELEAPLSPLNQSPSLSPADKFPTWRPPRPPSASDIEFRLRLEDRYLLGEGRYAQVYLASCRKGKAVYRTRPPLANHQDHEGRWHLCAAKRLAPDRDSQTMGLREAFFLNRLSGSTNIAAGRASSPLRETSTRPTSKGSRHIIKLIAVKEESGAVEQSAKGHSRSASDATSEQTSHAARHRRSTLVSREDEALRLSRTYAEEDSRSPAFSRLVLLLEHAPLGTLDRLLRTSPSIVGQALWERWAEQAASALAWVHSKGVLHADVKPGNFLVRDPKRSVLMMQMTGDLDLRLSDFGSAVLIHPAQPPVDGVGLGTLPFSPPELVDPKRSFSYPADVFALGATLYQCITGREPYRGLRAVEMMMFVKKGAFWSYEERTRIGRIGAQDSDSGVPYPSAWREPAPASVRRAGSLHEPISKHRQSTARPRLGRMGSASSLKASEDAVDGPNSAESPAGIKLWAHWMRDPNPAVDSPIADLLAETDGPALGHNPPSPAASTQEQQPAATTPQADFTRLVPPLATHYPNGDPEMLFLGGASLVPDAYRSILRSMLDPDPDARPSAADVLSGFYSLGVDV